MNPGRMDRQVAIATPTTARDAYGATIPGWTTIATVWGRVAPASGSEVARLGTRISAGGFRVTIRYRADVDETAQVTIDGVAMAVKSVDEVGRREYLNLFCEVVK